MQMDRGESGLKGLHCLVLVDFDLFTLAETQVVSGEALVGSEIGGGGGIKIIYIYLRLYCQPTAILSTARRIVH